MGTRPIYCFLLCTFLSFPAFAQSISSKEDCEAKNGKWGVHGLANKESCVLRNKDAGKVCYQNSDCSGDCIADGGFEIVSSGPPELGYHLGKCAEFKPQFGCYTVLFDKVQRKHPTIEKIPALCVD